MVSEEEFVVAMLCAIAFGVWTLYLLLRTRSLKKRLKAELQRSADDLQKVQKKFELLEIER